MLALKKVYPQNSTQSELLTFTLVLPGKIKWEILTLNNQKTSREGHIPVNIFKDATDAYLPILTKVINSWN